MKNPNNIKNKLATIAISALFVSGLAHAQESAGTRGGGDAVVSDNAVRLRDLLDPGNCTWKAGKSVLNDNPGIMDVLNKVQEVNQYFATNLKDEIKALRWCFTTTLKQIDTNDNSADKLNYYIDPYAKNKIQVGVRVLNIVYVDSNVVNTKMLANDRPYFFIHEALHGFIDYNATLRNHKIHDTIAAIAKLYKNEINADDFDATLSGSKVDTILGSNKVQNLVKIIVDEKLTLTERIALAKSYPYKDVDNTLVDQALDITDIFSKRDLIKLREKTGLAKFDLLLNNVPPYFDDIIGDKVLLGNCIMNTDSRSLFNQVTKQKVIAPVSPHNDDPGFNLYDPSVLFFTDACDVTLTN